MTKLIKEKEKIKNLFPISAGFGIDIAYKEFEYKNDKGRLRYGVLPEDVILTHPEMVYTDHRGDQVVSEIDLLMKEIATLKDEVRLLKLKP